MFDDVSCVELVEFPHLPIDNVLPSVTPLPVYIVKAYEEETPVLAGLATLPFPGKIHGQTGPQVLTAFQCSSFFFLKHFTGPNTYSYIALVESAENQKVPAPSDTQSSYLSSLTPQRRRRKRLPHSNLLLQFFFLVILPHSPKSINECHPPCGLSPPPFQALKAFSKGLLWTPMH